MGILRGLFGWREISEEKEVGKATEGGHQTIGEEDDMRSNRLLGRRAYLLVLALLATVLAVEVPAANGGTFPGGNGLIVFAADQFAVDDLEIHTMNPDGSGLTQITNTTGINRYPSWSPDGTKIAFSSTRDTGNLQIYVMNADGTSQTRLTTKAGDDQTPSWSPDGAKIAFMSNRVTVDNPTGDFEIFVMNANGSGVTQLTFNTIHDSSPSYSPDGTKIVFDSGDNGASEIWVMAPDGTGQTQLTFNGGTQDVGPRWSPDGTNILWRRDFGGCGQADIWVMKSDSTSPSPLICDSVGHESGGTYSPDGTKMLFGSTRDFFGGWQKEELYVANADGTGQTRITTTTYSETDHDWQPLVTPAPVGGTVTGVNLRRVTCRNVTTRKSVVIKLPGAMAWDCEAAGLVVHPGDRIRIDVNGRAQ